jgi:hypothetical protein
MKPEKQRTQMETMLLKIMLSWAIMIIGFIALFAGCNSPRTNEKVNDDHSKDSLQKILPDNTRTDGIKQKHLTDTTAIDTLK